MIHEIFQMNTIRAERIRQLQQEKYDILVIGGGATGSGIALDAATRGMKTALIEMQDFAAGTSSRSTKLIHGGLRYLKQFEISLVRETGRERAIVHKLAPHLVVPEKMLLPIIKDGNYSKLLTSFGLMVYDILAGVEKSDQRVMLNKQQTLQKEPLLREDVLEGSGYYAEYRTDDARLTIELIKTAEKYGAHPVNYVQAREFVYKAHETGKKTISGINCTDLITGNTFIIHARQAINAAGPWVDELREINQSLEGKHLHLTKGVHLVVPHQRFPVNQAVYFDVPDGRMMFAIPRGKITYIGTTDTEYQGEKETPLTLMEDVSYILEGVNHIFPDINLKPEEVISSWAGLRPLIHEDGKSASEISRKDEIFISDTRLISIAGGKLTGYRKMAERVIDTALKLMGEKSKKCRTDKTVLQGGDFANSRAVLNFREKIAGQLSDIGLDSYHANYLVANYGTQTNQIIEIFHAMKNHHPELRLLMAELQFTIEHEMVVQPVDFFIRRTGRLYFDIDSIHHYQQPVLAYFQEHFQWDKNKYDHAKKDLEQAVYEASHFPVKEAVV